MKVLLPALVTLTLGPGALAARVAVPGADVSVELPAGFRPMPKDIIDLKYSRGTPPTHVYSSPGPSWAVNIAFALRPAALPPGPLTTAQKALEGSIENTPGFRWVARGTERAGGREWIVLRFWVQGLDGPIYNHLRVTRQGQKTLLVTANVTQKLYPRFSAQLDAAMKSLK